MIVSSPKPTMWFQKETMSGGVEKLRRPFSCGLRATRVPDFNNDKRLATNDDQGAEAARLYA